MMVIDICFSKAPADCQSLVLTMMYDTMSELVRGVCANISNFSCRSINPFHKLDKGAKFTPAGGKIR